MPSKCPRASDKLRLAKNLVTCAMVLDLKEIVMFHGNPFDDLLIVIHDLLEEVDEELRLSDTALDEL